MTKDKMLVGTAALLSALNEAPPGEGAPSGHLYAVMMGGYSLTEFLALQSILIRGGLATLENQMLSLTGPGRETALEVEAALAKGVPEDAPLVMSPPA